MNLAFNQPVKLHSMVMNCVEGESHTKPKWRETGMDGWTERHTAGEERKREREGHTYTPRQEEIERKRHTYTHRGRMRFMN